MAGKKLQEMSSEELFKQKKSIRFVVGLLIGVLFASISLLIYVYINEDFTPSLIMLFAPLGFVPLVFISLTNLKAIEKEIQARNKAA